MNRFLLIYCRVAVASTGLLASCFQGSWLACVSQLRLLLSVFSLFGFPAWLYSPLL